MSHCPRSRATWCHSWVARGLAISCAIGTFGCQAVDEATEDPMADTETDSGIEDEATGSETDSVNEPGDPQTIAGYRLLVEVADPWNGGSQDDAPHAYDVVDVTESGIDTARLTVPPPFEEVAGSNVSASISSDGRYAALRYDAEGIDPTPWLHDLGTVRDGQLDGHALSITLDAERPWMTFSADGSVLALRDASDELVLVDPLDPDHRSTLSLPLDDASDEWLRPRPGTAELLVRTGTDLYWHPGVPLAAAPVLLRDDLDPELDDAGTARSVDTELLTPDLLALRVDDTLLVAEVANGGLHDVRSVEISIAGMPSVGCREPIWVGTDDAPAILCWTASAAFDAAFEPHWVAVSDDGFDTWGFHEFGPMQIDAFEVAVSNDGRFLVYRARHVGQRQLDGVYVVDTMTRVAPVRLPLEGQVVSLWSCGGQLWIDTGEELMRVTGLEAWAPDVETTGAGFDGDPLRTSSCREPGDSGSIGSLRRRYHVDAQWPGQPFLVADLDEPAASGPSVHARDLGEVVYPELSNCSFSGCPARILARHHDTGRQRELWAGNYHGMTVIPIVLAPSEP